MNDFLRSAEEQLILNKNKTAVMSELSDHYETKKEFFESIGYDEEASAEKANEAMGDGIVVGQRLNIIHHSNTIIKKLLVASVIIVNTVLFFLKSPKENSVFFIPFLMALLALISNFLFTATAIKFKSNKISTALIVCASLHFLLQDYTLAYSLCNIVVRILNREDNYYLTIFFPIVTTLFLNALIIIPNAINIHHCKQIKKLKNTKKQNRISLSLRNACVIAAVASLVISVPCFAVNERINDEQTEIRDELFAFVLNTIGQFNYNEWDALSEYLENCEYDFKHIQKNYESSKDGKTYTTEVFVYNKGANSISFFSGSLSNGYNVNSYANHTRYYSLKYLYTTAEKIDELVEKIGDPNIGPGNIVGHSSREFLCYLIGFDLIEIYVDKGEDGTIYECRWEEPHDNPSSFDGYVFYCDTDDICYSYELH